MKVIAFILVVCICCMSCSKESCWECDVNSAGVKYKERFCDRSKKEIQTMEDNPLLTKDNAGTVIYTTTFSNCVMQ